jgi:hypothetical protein
MDEETVFLLILLPALWLLMLILHLIGPPVFS